MLRALLVLAALLALVVPSQAAIIYTQALASNDSGNGGYSFRVVVPITGGAQTQVRVTFNASSVNPFQVDHASIGVSNGGPSAGSGPTQAAPVELLFSGVSGFSLTAGQTAVSDWTNFSGFTASDDLVVIYDIHSTNGNQAVASGLGSTVETWFKSATASYNVQSPAAFSPNVGFNWGVSKIEVQGGGGTPMLMLFGVGQ